MNKLAMRKKLNYAMNILRLNVILKRRRFVSILLNKSALPSMTPSLTLSVTLLKRLSA